MTTPTTQARPRGQRLEDFRPLVLTPSTWPKLLRDTTPVGNWLDVGRE